MVATSHESFLPDREDLPAKTHKALFLTDREDSACVGSRNRLIFLIGKMRK